MVPGLEVALVVTLGLGSVSVLSALVVSGLQVSLVVLALSLVLSTLVMPGLEVTLVVVVVVVVSIGIGAVAVVGIGVGVSIGVASLGTLGTLVVASNKFVLVPLGVTSRIGCCIVGSIVVVVVVVVAVLVLVCLSRLVTLLALFVLASLVVRLSDFNSGKDWQGASWSSTKSHQGCKLSSTGRADAAVTGESLSGERGDEGVGEVHVV